MKKTVTLILIGMLAFPLSSFAAYPVFDATNNLLATLQKTMDSTFQTVQKANMSTLIQQGKEDFAEQVKIYEECVKQYEECVKIYKQAVRMYDWIDTNVGNARNLKTFLSCGFSDVKNLQQMFLRLNTILRQTATSTNRNYNLTLLQQAERIIGNDVLKQSADRGIEMQNYAQASEKLADKSDEISQTMLTNISSINRTVAKQLEIHGQDEMNQAQEAAAYDLLEKEAIERGSRYTNQKNSWNRINSVFDNCRVF